MKHLKLFLFTLIAGFGLTINAQTADEIIETYLENIGGAESWNKLDGIKLSVKINQGGMEIPAEIVRLKEGKQMVVIDIQGQKVKQNVFDGEVLWNTNMMTQKAEKGTQEAAENMKLEKANFPDPFLNYKDKGYSIELMGKEEIDGTNTFKIKLTKSPMLVDGKKEDNISYYFFDTENFVPIAMQNEIKSGPMKGKMSQITFSDYQEVDGLYFAFSMTQGLKDQPGFSMSVDGVELNPDVDVKAFEYPEDEASEEPKDKN
ncbi:outer membrane lipoprotein-sorting protein [Winogradskyella flava]|uniref:Outer membrane lipoprotein-sorting protein n=1 Tax=Winogradskyella flava TaxID=1884876 RepID=A0A842IQN4_9FLAO|nr:outer membrane lipoprotein-sorting protein [Winogradskyella flava]MBC2845035.1 outer membrane lipoprotein-sorting protein [Winogradskyella flava]